MKTCCEVLIAGTAILPYQPHVKTTNINISIVHYGLRKLVQAPLHICWGCTQTSCREKPWPSMSSNNLHRLRPHPSFLLLLFFAFFFCFLVLIFPLYCHSSMPDFLSIPYKTFLLFDNLLAGWTHKYITKCLKVIKHCPSNMFSPDNGAWYQAFIPKRYKVSSGNRKLGWKYLREGV